MKETDLVRNFSTAPCFDQIHNYVILKQFIICTFGRISGKGLVNVRGYVEGKRGRKNRGKKEGPDESREAQSRAG
jgi:hypothetical protein